MGDPATGRLASVAQDLLCVVDDEDHIAWAGGAWGRELGLEPDEVCGRPLRALAHPDDGERLVDELASMRGRDAVLSGFECRCFSATGSVHWIRWAGVTTPEGLTLSGRDVTALRDPDHGRAELVAAALDAIVTIDGHDRIVEFNPSAERTFGIARHEAMGRSLTELIVPPALRDSHREGVRRVASGGAFRLLGRRLELNAMRVDGTEFPAELTITQTSSEPFLVTAFIRDRSAEQTAREALLESEARYANAFDQAPVGIALVSIDPSSPGRLLRVNGALERMTGYSEPELLGLTFLEVTHPDDRESNDSLVREVLAGARQGYEIETRFLRRDGSVMWALVSGTVARDGDGRALYGIGQVQDITVRKEAEERLRANEQRLARTERLARIGAWEWDLRGDRFSWSAGLDDIFGVYDATRPPALDAFLGLVHPGDRARVHQINRDALAGRIAKTWEYRILRGDEITHMYAWGEVVLGEDDAPIAIQGYVQDVTERKRAEKRAEDLRRDHDVILDAAGEGIFRVDAQGRTTYVNPAGARLLGAAPADLVGRPLHDAVHALDPLHEDQGHGSEECPIRLTLANGAARKVTDDLLRHRDGTRVAVEYTVAPTLDADEVTGAVIVFNDVTARRDMEERLRRYAEVDALTGLMNRRKFEETLAEHVADRRAGDGALLMLDLDHFKFVNDSFGHAAGDDLIRTIAGVLTERLRDGDVLARLGGDEFAVLLRKADAGEATSVAHRLVTAIDEVRPSGQPVGASVGAMCFAAGSGAVAGDLLISADIALYEAKERGRGRVEFFAGTPGASLTGVQLIRAALEEDRFVLYAQPIVDVASGRTVQEELLLRMLDEDGEVIPPGQFLSTAETFGLIGDIDRWVVARSVAVAATGRRVHVNLSGRSVGCAGLIDELEELLESTGADPADLIFEITETTAIANMTDARSFVERLRSLGCGLALDDFGTGFGSFTYLRNLPADYLKIDMDFVRDLSSSTADLRVVEAIVATAHHFGLRTVAEGVEDENALRLLRAAGVDLAQGYHLGRPAPA